MTLLMKSAVRVMIDCTRVQAFHIDCANRAALIDIDSARHPADNPVRMRVLTAKHRMDFDDPR